MSVQENVLIVLERVTKLTKENDYFAEQLAHTLESLFNALAADDEFGTEQQSDPRGDFREGYWSILDKVQK